jgi:hypothetical protein
MRLAEVGPYYDSANDPVTVLTGLFPPEVESLIAQCKYDTKIRLLRSGSVGAIMSAG